MSKHTPGPWKAEKPGAFAHYEIYADAAGPLATVYNNSISNAARTECKANARLIATAPELLDFAILVAQGQHGELKGEFISKVRAKAKELIAKATGEMEVQP